MVLYQSISAFLCSHFLSFKCFQAKIKAAALKLEQQIILADCQVLAAILNFINQVSLPPDQRIIWLAIEKKRLRERNRSSLI